MKLTIFLIIFIIHSSFTYYFVYEKLYKQIWILSINKEAA